MHNKTWVGNVNKFSDDHKLQAVSIEYVETEHKYEVQLNTENMFMYSRYDSVYCSSSGLRMW